MVGTRWFKGANYYQVKGWLLKKGFDVTEDRGFVPNSNNTKCYCTYSCGTEEITLYYTIKPGKTEKFICDKVYKYTNKIFDNVNITNKNYKLNETLSNQTLTNEDYQYGYCDTWALENYKSGDKFFIITDYDDNIECEALVHCGLFRNNQYIDVSGCYDNIDDILFNYDYMNPTVEIIDRDVFIQELQEFGIC